LVEKGHLYIESPPETFIESPLARAFHSSCGRSFSFTKMLRRSILLLTALATLAVASNDPPGYFLVASGIFDVFPRRFFTAFDASALIGSEVKNGDVSSCAAACNALPACRAFFFWTHVETRCRLLSKASATDLFPTFTDSLSYLKNEASNYKLVATGAGGQSRRFPNAFNSPIFSNTVNTNAACFAACDTNTACVAVFFHKDSGVWKCNGLSSAPYTFASTNLEGYSYAKVVSTAPNGYTIAAEGATHTNPSAALRFAAAFEVSALISQTLDLTLEQCAAACDTEFTCRGAFWYLLGGQWRCRLLNTLTTTSTEGTFELVPTGQVGVSLKRSVMPTTTTTTTTTTTPFYPGAVFQVTSSPANPADVGYYKLTGFKEYKKINADGTVASPERSKCKK